ncbi:VOC family protein [Actinomadura hibisca]|uniref:VOC family protein n=1 Tax=Actinomadura hibisca TaxID=68565 RepID=UPI00083775AB|nr:VOC family protein [Actinomadura hibisca]
METVSVRYIVDDVAAASAFYTGRLGFDVVFSPGPDFAMLARGALRLLLNEPKGSGEAAEPGAEERPPAPGGWNRIQIRVCDLAQKIAELEAGGARFRGEIVTGRGGRRILVEDPSGNPVELFEPFGGD